MPDPVLHSFSSEREVALHIPPKVTFYEEATYWNTVWGTPAGANESTNIYDLIKTAVAVGTGKLLSRPSYHAMTDSNLLGFGHQQASCVPAAERVELHRGGSARPEDRHRRSRDLRALGVQLPGG